MSRKNTFDDVVFLAAKLPWWLGVGCALLSYLLLHHYSLQPLTPASGLDDLFKGVYIGVFRAFAAFGQYILPLLFLLGALLSVLQKRKRKNLFNATSRCNSAESLNDMPWWDFEFLVGEYFRRMGFRVEETGKGADGGYDLIAVKDREKFLIQCKQWRVDTVGVKIVRELFGVVTAEQASGGIVVTSGKFSKDALAFARANKIMLIDGKELHGNIRSKAGTEDGPDSKRGSDHRKLKWTCAALLPPLVGGAVLLFTEPGKMAYSSFSARMKELMVERPGRQDPAQSREIGSARQPQENDRVFSGEQVRQAMEDVLRNNSRQAENNDGEGAAEPVFYRYEIELHSGGWISVDNAEITDKTIIYTGRRGLVVSLDRDEVRSMKRVRVEKE